MYQYRMSTSSTRTNSPQTNLRRLRRLLTDAMEAAEETPAICIRIRKRREELYERDKEIAVRERRKNEFSQERLAQKIGVSLKAYRSYEAFREPPREKRRRIAVALELPENFFDPAEISEQVRQVVREELGEVLPILRRLEALLADEG